MADNGNMTVSVSFPGLEKKSEPIRSLISFMMENSSLYFKKNASGGDGIFTVESYDFDGPAVYLSLSGDWLDITRDIFVYGKVNYDSIEYSIAQPVYECSGTAEVSCPDGDLGPDPMTGWESLIASVMMPRAIEFNESSITITLLDSEAVIEDDPEEDVVISPLEFNGTLHVYGDFYSNDADPLSIDGEYEFTNGVCVINTDSEYNEGECYVFSTSTETSLTGTIRNRYTCGDSCLYIKYNDENNDKFKPIPKPIAAEAHDSITGLSVRAKHPGVAGNNYRVEFVSEGSGSNLVVHVNIYNGDELVSTQTPYQFFILSQYTTITIYCQDIDDTSDLTFSGSTAYVNVNEFPITIQLAGGADDGNTSDTTSDGVTIDCNTVLCKANTNVTVGDFSNLYYGGEISAVDCELSDVDVTITPVINGKVNKDETSIPLDFNPKGYLSVPLNNGKKVEYSTQLRTTSFVVASSNYDEELDEWSQPEFTRVFYKVGICPLDGTTKSRDDLVELLKHGFLSVNSEYYMVSAALSVQSSSYHRPYICSPGNDYIIDLDKYIENYEYYNEAVEMAPKTAILPIYDSPRSSGGKDDYEKVPELVGFAYLKLCNTNGTPYTIEADYDCVLEEVPEEGDELYTSTVYLAFKDSMLDGGFTQFPRVVVTNGGYVIEPGGKEPIYH